MANKPAGYRSDHQVHSVPGSGGAPRRRIFFLHIPKTGGTSINEILSTTFGRAVFIEVADNEKAVERIPAVMLASIVSGHQFYPFIDVCRPCDVVTLIRNPVDRALSAFKYISRTHSHTLNRALQGFGGNRLEVFLTHPLFMFHSANLQTRMLGADYDLKSLLAGYRAGRTTLADTQDQIRQAENKPCDDSMLARAVERLESFSVVGTTETFEQTIRRLAASLGVSCPARLPHLKKAPLEGASEPTEHETELLQEANQYDIALYSYALRYLNRSSGAEPLPGKGRPESKISGDNSRPAELG